MNNQQFNSHQSDSQQANTGRVYDQQANTGRVYDQQDDRSRPGKGKAIASLVLGIISIIDFTIFVGLFAGIIGIVLAVSSKNDGFNGGIRTAGFVCSIVGLVFSVLLLIFAILVIVGSVAYLDSVFGPYFWDYVFYY